MFETAAEVAHGSCELGFDAVAAAARRGGVVRFVEDQQASGKHRSEPFTKRVGVGRIDPSAAHAPVGFRLIIVPGTVALWPLLAIRWLRGQQAPAESTAHKRAAVRLASVRARGEDRP